MTGLVTAGNRGVLTETSEGWELRFERRLRHAPDRVWAVLTTGEGLAGWLAEAEIELAPGGRMELNFRQPEHAFMPDTPERRRQSNRVLTVRPPDLFEHTFGGDDRSVVTWRLAPDGDGTHLTLIHRIPADWRGSRDSVLSGWHHHMEGLDAAAQGRRHGWDWDRWFALRDAYAAEIADADPPQAERQRDAPEAASDRGASAGGKDSRTPPVVETGMTIRRPIAEVYRAFVDPTVTTRFWFTRASGPLTPGAAVRWDWDMYGVGADVSVKALEPPCRILIEWDGPDAPTDVEWRLEERGAGITHVAVINRGFHGDDDVRLAAALDSMGGFSLVLAGAKAWLEHGLALNLVADRFPEAWTEAWGREHGSDA